MLNASFKLIADPRAAINKRINHTKPF